MEKWSNTKKNDQRMVYILNFKLLQMDVQRSWGLNDAIFVHVATLEGPQLS
jgi:hypothetical protein